MARTLNLRDRLADRDDGCKHGGASCLRCPLLPCVLDLRDGTIPILPDRRPGIEPTKPPELMAPGRSQP